MKFAGRGDTIGSGVGGSASAFPSSVSRSWIQQSTPSSCAASGHQAPCFSAPSSSPCQGHTRRPSRTGPSAREAPMCGQAFGATRSSGPARHATSSRPSTQNRRGFLPIDRLASSTYQPPDGMASAAWSSRSMRWGLACTQSGPRSSVGSSGGSGDNGCPTVFSLDIRFSGSCLARPVPCCVTPGRSMARQAGSA